MSYKYKEYLETPITTVATQGYSEMHPLTYITLSTRAIYTTFKSRIVNLCNPHMDVLLFRQ
jgi:hypothetical protein